MSEKQNASLLARQKGEPIERPKMLTQSAVANLITTGLYKVVYDGNGLQQAGVTVSNPDSTWYNFNITNTQGTNVGHYHVHPTTGKFKYASGNLRMNDDSSFGSYIVGRAIDWRWLCNGLTKDM